MTITIPIYMPVTKTKIAPMSMNWYRNAFYQQSNKVKKEIHELILQQITEKTVYTKLRVHYKLFYKNSNCDLMNFGSLASKFLLDALQLAGIIKKDTVKVVIEELFEVAGQDKNNPRIEATLYGLD